jgi:hypothetical protein
LDHVPAGEMTTTMASLVDDRRDMFTVSNLARSILIPQRERNGKCKSQETAGGAALCVVLR